jgi:hypothetical protein
MSQKNDLRHYVKCQITTEPTVELAVTSRPKVPSTKRKEDAKQTLYLKRI